MRRGVGSRFPPQGLIISKEQITVTLELWTRARIIFWNALSLPPEGHSPLNCEVSRCRFDFAIIQIGLGISRNLREIAVQGKRNRFHSLIFHARRHVVYNIFLLMRPGRD